MTKKEEKKVNSWDQQEGEKDKPYYFFLQYANIEEPITIEKFHEKIKEIENENETPYNIPQLRTVYNWSSVCSWNDRKADYRRHILSCVGEKLEEAYLEKLLKKFNLNDEIDLLILEEVKSILEDENYKGNKAWNIEKFMRANSVTVENQRLIAGEPTEIIHSKNSHEIDADVNLKNNALKKTQEILGSDEYRKHEIGLLNAINKKQKGDKTG